VSASCCYRRTDPVGDTRKSMTVAQIEIPEAEIAGVCQRHGIRRLALFGSALTDRFSESSDIDLLVEFRPNA
jgi:predicted nucleotidyltransferase